MSSYINQITGKVLDRQEAQDMEYLYKGKPLIIETDSDRNITYANRRFVETSGYSREEVIGSPHCMHMHPDMPAGVFKNACNFTDQGKTWSGMVQNIDKEGVAYWTELLIQPKINEVGRIIGYMATRREMDASKLYEVKEEYKMMRDAGEETVRVQFCGEVYLGESASCPF